MQIYVLDSDPVRSAKLLTRKLQRKMLVEQMQLLSSHIYRNEEHLYKDYMYLPQTKGKAKELVSWVSDNLPWNLIYLKALLDEVIRNNPEKCEGYLSVNTARQFLGDSDLESHCNYNYVDCNIHNVSFRCKKEYMLHERLNKKTLPLDIGLSEYVNYWKWNLKNYSLLDKGEIYTHY